MAEIEFIWAPEDGLEFVKFFLDQGCWLAPDLHYARPVHEKLRSVDVVKAAQYDPAWPAIRFFIGREDFCTLPLEMHQIGDGPNARPENVGKWFIMPRNGGASIDLSLNPRAKDRGFVPAGSIGYYPDYWCNNTTVNYKAPEALKALYKEAIKFMKKRARHWRTKGGNSYWVWDGAVEMLKQGYRFPLAGYEDPNKILSELPAKKRPGSQASE